jgi:hypothetical protein
MFKLYKITSGRYEENVCSFFELRSQHTQRSGSCYHDKTLYIPLQLKYAEIATPEETHSIIETPSYGIHSQKKP